MKGLVKLFVFLIGVLLIAWGATLVSLGFLGESASARNVTTRRVGGERDDSSPNRYTYSISYEFVTHAGDLASGSTQGIGSSYSVETPDRIRYFADFPQVNAPADDCGLAAYPMILIGAGSVVVWSFRRKKRRVAAQVEGSIKRAKAGTPLKRSKSANNRLSATEWLRKYRRDSRRYAWGFFVVVVVVIGILVRTGLEEWNDEWFYATGFAALLTWVLALFSRRTAESSWAGVVVSKEIKEAKDTRNQDMNTMRTTYIVHVETDRGKSKKVRVGPAAFGSYREGGRVRKIAGLSFPLPEEFEEGSRICPVCGSLLDGAVDACGKCRAPVYSLAEFE